MCKAIDKVLAMGFKLESGIYKRINIIKAEDCNPESNYRANAFPESYTLTKGEWVHYLAEIQILDPSDLDDIEDSIVYQECDGNGFWAKSDNPRLELKQRLLDFETIILKAFEGYPSSFWGSPSLNYIPSDNEFCCISWVNFYLADIKISADFITAKNQIESLMYKYRKMVELYNSHKHLIDLL